MKMFKKISALLAATAMMFMSVTTANAEGTSNPLTLSVEKEGSTFEVYKVLDARKGNDGTNDLYTWSVNSSFTDFFGKNKDYTFDATKGIVGKDGKTIPVQYDDNFKNDANTTNKQEGNKGTYYKTSADMDALTAKLNEYIATKNINPIKKNMASLETLGVQPGYYFVREITTGSDVVLPSKPMLVSITDTSKTLFPKDSDVDTTKKIVEDGKEIDKNSAGLNDTIEYKVTTNIPVYNENIYDTATVKYELNDVLSEGLTFNESSLKITVNGKDEITLVKDTDYTINKSVDDKNNTVITVSFVYNSIKQYAYDGLPLVYSYTATVNEKAISYDELNNSVHIEYTKDQNDTSKGNTITTTTYTYGFDLHKVDQEGNNAEDLDGTQFTITKYTDESFENVDNTFEPRVFEVINGTASFKALDNGYYSIKETFTPSGYAKLDVEIHLLIEDEMNDGVMTGKAKITLIGEYSNEDVTVEKGNQSSINTQNGFILKVKNYKGINLPETGGMGTTIFMIGGAALIALAGVMLVVYSKKSKKA